MIIYLGIDEFDNSEVDAKTLDESASTPMKNSGIYCKWWLDSLEEYSSRPQKYIMFLLMFLSAPLIVFDPKFLSWRYLIMICDWKTLIFAGIVDKDQDPLFDVDIKEEGKFWFCFKAFL